MTASVPEDLKPNNRYIRYFCFQDYENKNPKQNRFEFLFRNIPVACNYLSRHVFLLGKYDSFVACCNFDMS